MDNKPISKPQGNQTEEAVEVSVEQKLMHLYRLQLVESQIDKIKNCERRIPLEVQDLEDEMQVLKPGLIITSRKLLFLRRESRRRKM